MSNRVNAMVIRIIAIYTRKRITIYKNIRWLLWEEGGLNGLTKG